MKYVVLSLIIFAGCTTNEGAFRTSKEVEARLTQLSPMQVASKLGAPTETLEVDRETKVWTYRSEDDFINGGKCTVSVTIKENVVVSSSVKSQDRSWVAFPLGSCASIIGTLD